MKDNLFNSPSKKNSFEFDKTISSVFDDMAVRSIPGYISQQLFMTHTTLSYIQNLKKNTNNVLDIACSTGETIACMSDYVHYKELDVSDISIYLNDYSKDMIEQCKKKTAPVTHIWKSFSYHNIDITQADEYWNSWRQMKEKASVIFAHFILQFLPLSKREEVLKNCWDILEDGGCILIGEKLRHRDTQVQEEWEQMQYNFKRSMGYSHMQIESKRNALEGVLISQFQDDFIAMLDRLPQSEHYMYYAHGEFQCYVIRKKDSI